MLFLRHALTFALATLALGCDDVTPEGPCLPEQGCVGIVQIQELDVEPTLDFQAQLRPDWCAEESETLVYVEETPQACDAISILCEPDWVLFDDACGCGCAYEN